MRLRPLILLLAPAIASGCGSDSPRTGPSDAVHDSAGIRIVEVEPRQAGWAVSSAPVATLGVIGSENEEAFSWVASGLFLPDGRIAIPDFTSQTIPVFNVDGSLSDTWGAEGDGPGEFRRLGFIYRYPGDSVLVSEVGARLLHVFSANGEYARSVPTRPSYQLPSSDFMREESCCDPWAVMGNGSLLVSYPELIPRSGPDPRFGIATLTTFDRESGAVDTLGVFRGQEYRASTGDYPVESIPTQYGVSAAFAPTREGFLVWEAGPSELKLFESSGEWIGVTRVLRPRIPSDANTRAATEAFWRERANGSERSLESFMRPPFPDSLPAYFRWYAGFPFRVDASGHVWAPILAPHGDEGAQRFDVFNSEGTYVGEVSFPFPTAFLDANETHAITLTRGELDEPLVHIFELTRN